jgi:hypothetical protein
MSNTGVEDEEAGGRLSMPAPGVKRYLAGYMDRGHLESFVGDVLATRPTDEVEQFWARHASTNDEKAKLPQVVLDPGPLRLLEGSDAEWAQAVASTERFKREIAGPHMFAWVPLDKLIAFQPLIDAGQPLPGASADEILRWCLPQDFPKTTADPPQVMANAAWSGPRLVLATRDLNAQLSFDVRDGAVSLSLVPRGNWLQVAAVGSALVLRNGYHRACALAAAGHTHAPALVLPMADLGTAIPNSPAFFRAGYIQGLHRPPLVLDLLSPGLTVDIAHAPQKRVVEIRLDIMDMRIPV